VKITLLIWRRRRRRKNAYASTSKLPPTWS